MTEHNFIEVGAVMTPSPFVIDGLSSVRRALEKMDENQVSSLVIDRRYDGDEYGILTVEDIAGKVIAINRSVDRTSVYEIMTKPVLTVNIQMDIKYAIRLLARFKLMRALVTEHGEMVGIVTLRDMTVRYLNAETTRHKATASLEEGSDKTK